jgi:hypothetical protein
VFGRRRGVEEGTTAAGECYECLDLMTVPYFSNF